MGKVTAEEMQGLMYGNSNNTARSGGSSTEKVSASEVENLMAPYRSQEIKHTVLSPSTQPTQAASAGASSGVRKQSDTMKEQVDALKKQRDDAALRLSAYMRAGNMQKQAEEQFEIANRAGIDYANAYTNWKNQRNMEAVKDYNPEGNHFKAGDAVLSGVQNAFQSTGQAAVAASSYLSGSGVQATKAWKAKRLMDSGVKGTDAVKQAGLMDKREIPITDYKTKAELRHEKNLESVGAVEGGALQLINTISNMVPSIVANQLLLGAGLPLMAASAAGNKYSDAYEKYGNTDMAFVLGSAAGGASMFTESFGGIFGKAGNTAIGKAASKKLMEEAPGLFLLANSKGGKLLRDAFSEGLEEGAEDLINYGIEKALTGDSDEMDNFGYDMLLGALAGGVLGGVGTVVRTKAYNRLGKALNASPDAVSQLVEKGTEKGPGTAPYIYAQEVQKNPSNQMVGKLYDATVAYNADQGLSKLSTDVAQVTVEELKDMISLADRLAEAAKKLGVEANPEAVTAAVINKQTNAAVQAAENAVGEAYAPTVETPTNAGETAYNSALAGGVANQGIATRINNDPAAKQSFVALTGANFTGEAAHDIAEIQVATKRLAQSGKQAVSQSDYDAMVANAGEQARARVTAEQQAQVEQLNAESEARRQSLLYNTIVDENGKRHVKEITDTDVRGDTEIGYKKAEITKSKKKSVDAVNNAAKYLGKTIVWFDGALQINGQYRLANGFRAPDGTIYVNINSADPLMVTFGHEMFHDLVSGGKYGGMIDTLVESPEYAATIKVELEHKEELYRANGIELTADEAAEEVAADICGSILGSKSMLEYIGARNAETATGIKGWLDRILNKLKGKPTAQEAYERLSESQRALIDGMEGRTEAEENKNVKYQLSDNAMDDVHYAVTHPGKGGYIRLRDITPNVLVEIGVKDLPMHMKASHIRENVLTDAEAKKLGITANGNTAFHGLGEQLFLSAVDGLDTPVEVYRWKKNGHNRYGENDFIVITPAKDANGNNVIVPFVINSSAKENNVWVASNEIKSAYGKENLRRYINKYVELGALERKKIRPPATSGVQFPGGGSDASVVAQARLISNNRIADAEPAVNTHSMQTGAKNAQEKLSLMETPTTDSTGRELSAEQKEYFKDSKVRDEDGNLLVVYHGTDADFTVFDASKGRANMDIQGMFFSPWELDAQGYGSNVSAYYLDIKNPASEAVGYKALNRFKGQNNAGVKAREYLQSLGYDGVNNGNEEYIAFEPSQIKRIDNLTPTGSKDIRYSVMNLPNGSKYVHADRQVIFGNDPRSWGEQVEDYINGKIRNGEDVRLITDDGDVLLLTKDTAGKAKHNKKPNGTSMNDDEYEVKLNASVHIDELASISQKGKRTVGDYGGKHSDFAKNGWNYRTAFFQDFDGKYYRVRISIAQGKDGNVVYNIGSIEERSFPNVNGSSAKGGALNGKASDKKISETAPAVNTHSMQNSQIDAQGDYSLMDTLPQEKYFADLDQAVAEATAKSEEALKAAQNEVTPLRQQLLDYRNHADAEAKMNERWRDAEAKLVADLAAAREREKAAQLKAEYMQKYNSLAKQNREQYNEKVSALRDEYRQKQQQERTDRVVREEKAKSKARLDRAEAKSTTTEDVAEVLTEMPKKTEAEFKEKAAERWRTFKRNWVNTKDELERFGQAVGDHRITYAANNVGQASAAAQYSIGGLGQYDLNGHKIGEKNLKQIFEPAQKAGLTKEFYTYLLHEHNVDRMSIRERSQEQLAKLRADLDKTVPGFASLTDENLMAAASGDAVAAKSYTPEQIAAAKQYKLFREWVEKQFDKPVFGSSVTAADSRAAADKLLKEHPEFEKWAKDVYAYLDGLMEVRKQGGLVSEDMVQRMKELYPHYVPTYRDMPSTSGGYSNPNSVAVNSTIKSAKGGNQDIMPLIDSIARQTLQTFSAAKKNILGNMLYEDAMDTTRDISEYIQSVTEEGDLVDLDADSAENLKNTLRIWVDGKPVTLHMSEAMADGFRPIEQSNSFGMKALRSINSTFKKLVTQWNPVFIVRNFVRDAQSALYFTHYSNATFIKNYGKAVKEIATNGKYWQLYQAMGGKGTTYYDPKTGLSDRHHFKNGAVDKVAGGWNRVIDILSFANEAVEQYPRLAEFISTMEATGDVQQALYNAADITTNFGRGGFAARKLNASLAPFFNPGMQGLSKNIRNVIDRRGWKEIGQLISRLLINGVAPGIIMGLLYDGLKEDEDYKELSNYIKDSNILIKIGDDKFIKVPMGREPSVITAFTNRMWRWLKGEPASSAFADYPSFAIEQLAPNNPLTNNIFAGITAMSTNKNWYGGDIVSSYMEEKPDYLQYDESTDAFSIWLGEITRHGKNGIEGLSPKKVNYLIDQYSGFIGDWVLPALSKKADVPAVVKAFVVDSVRQNRLGSDFYDALDEAKQVKETEFATAADDATYSYLYKQSKAASEITKQLKEIYNSGEKTRKEKMSEARDLLELRNEIYRNALLTVGTYEETAKSIDSADSDVVKREANRKAFGAEYALKTYNKDVGEKAAEYVAQGVTYDQYYAAYFAARGITGDKDENGKTITNSASRKKKEAIDKAVPNATTKQKHLLYEAIGVSEKVW